MQASQIVEPAGDSRDESDALPPIVSSRGDRRSQSLDEFRQVRLQDLNDCHIAMPMMRTSIPWRWISRLTFASAAVCIGFAFYSLCIGAFENWLAMVSTAALLALVANRMTLEDELSPGNEEGAAASKRQRRCSQRNSRDS